MGPWGHGTTGLGTEGARNWFWAPWPQKVNTLPWNHTLLGLVTREHGWDIRDLGLRGHGDLGAWGHGDWGLGDVTMYQEKLANYSGKMLKHSIDSIVKVTWKRYFKVASRSSWWLPVTEVTMYIKSVLVVCKASLRLLKPYVAGSHQKRLGTYSGKMLPHSIESIAEVAWERLLQHSIASIVEVTWERCCNIASQALWRLLGKDVTT